MKGHLDLAAREFANAITGVPKPTVSELALPVRRYGLEIIEQITMSSRFEFDAHASPPAADACTCRRRVKTDRPCDCWLDRFRACGRPRLGLGDIADNAPGGRLW